MLSTRPLVYAGAAVLLPMAQALPLANELALILRKDDDDKDDDNKDDDVVKWFGLKIKKPIFIGVVVAFIIFCLIMAVGTTVWRYKKKKARKAKEATFEAPPAMIQQDRRSSSPQYISPPSPGGPNDPYANKNKWGGPSQWSNDDSSPYGNRSNNHQSFVAPSGPPPPTAHHPNRF